MSALRLGVDRADITPGRPVRLAGFAFRAGLDAATRTAAPLRLRTLAFAAGDERAVFVAADVLWWGFDLTDRVHRELERRYGLSPRSVLLHATHTHSAPQPSRGFAPSIGEFDPVFADQVVETAVDGVGRALAAVRPVRVERCADRADLADDRRARRSPTTVPRSSVDPEVSVVRFVCADDADDTVALLVHYTCHPVVHRDNEVSPDFPGAAMDLLEREHPGTVAVFAQGCCGDIDPKPGDSDQAAAERFGGELAAAVGRALHGLRVPAGPPRLATSARKVDLPLSGPPRRSDLTRWSADDGVRGEWARLLLAEPHRITDTAVLRVSTLRLTDDLGLAGLSGEPVGAYGRRVKVLSGGAVLPLGYTNGMTGYLVTARQLAEGGYEAVEAPLYFGLPGLLAPAAQDVLYDALAGAVRELRTPSQISGSTRTDG
ncbi:neutral/alkaline non-lysosomal ceramidase N-terminal domain-containing protein [Jiangella gansuensis]|uniref:neutral/alkaline non-lysosomal ceramidase N-terminal domain-containing protein n=1 Tax=Jiangella gansuensis TaxID=281473 RepID=UPI00047B7A51|nr:neutral/alkaline non-lysosomal ceramidase N-terminal domain-containing protein [Jiangella gansuensis]